MNNVFFNWHKTLNIKKVAIVSLITITTILLVFLLIFSNKKASKNNYTDYVYNKETNTTTFFDMNHSISLEISNIYELKQYAPIEDYLLELRSDQNLNIFISSKEKIDSKTFKEVVEADKLAYIQNFNNISNLSEVKEVNINTQNCCTYSFHYLDEVLNTTFYLQISWLEFNNNYYIFDIEFPLEDLNNYANIITDTLSNFSSI